MGGHDQSLADPLILGVAAVETPTYLLRKNEDARSEVWRVGDWVYKRQPKFLCDNELYCLNKLWSSGYVPWAEHVDLETIKIAWVEAQPITDRIAWLRQIPVVLKALDAAGIRHGDLTEFGVIPMGNRPVLIDFAESRLTSDPRPDKRPEGDAYWLKITMEKMVARPKAD